MAVDVSQNISNVDRLHKGMLEAALVFINSICNRKRNSIEKSCGGEDVLELYTHTGAVLGVCLLIAHVPSGYTLCGRKANNNRVCHSMIPTIGSVGHG